MNFPSYCYEKAPPPPLPPFWKGRGEMPPSCLHSLASLCIFFYTHSLCSLLWAAMCDCNNINCQRSPKTQQFMTAKISRNALKQGSRIHAVLRQPDSQLQKYKTARMSCGIAVDQKVCGRDVRHPGLTVWNLQTAQELRMRIKYARKFSFLVMWLLNVKLLKGKNRYGLVWADMIHPPELPVNDEARNEALIASTGVQLY